MAPSASQHKSHGLANPKASRPLEGKSRRTEPVTSGSPGPLHSPRQESAEGHVERAIRPQKRIIHPQIAAAASHLAQKCFELRLVGRTRGGGSGVLFLEPLQAAKARRLVERKILLGRIDDLQ